MKKLLMIVGLAVGMSQATVIHWSGSNDSKSLADVQKNDGLYTGYVDLIEYNDGSVSSLWSNSDPLIGKFVVMDTQTDMLYVTTNATPGLIASNALLTASFNMDLTVDNLKTGVDGYELSNLTFNNSIGSSAVNEFAQTAALYPGGVYTFSGQITYGNGQFGSVPEPTTLGLMGLGLMSLGFAARRKKSST